jgi:hypothetical protein
LAERSSKAARELAGEPLTGRATFPPQEDYQGQHQASQCWPHKAPKADLRLLSVSFSRQDLPVRRHHFGAGFLAFFLVAMFSSSSKVDKIFQRPNASTASEVYASDVAKKKFFARRRVERGFPATLARPPSRGWTPREIAANRRVVWIRSGARVQACSCQPRGKSAPSSEIAANVHFPCHWHEPPTACGDTPADGSLASPNPRLIRRRRAATHSSIGTALNAALASSLSASPLSAG